MIISRGRRYIFVHIPKTGGTSMAAALEARAMADDILIGDTPKARRRRRRLAGLTARGRLWKHSTLADIDGLVTPEELEGFFVVTMVRNPWDRLLSYYHWLREQTWSHPEVTAARALGFSAFLSRPELAVALKGGYASAVCDATGAERCDCFVRLEHLASDLAPLEGHLGFTLAPFPHLNASARGRGYRPAYRDADAERVAALCAGDIARFGYAF